MNPNSTMSAQAQPPSWLTPTEIDDWLKDLEARAQRVLANPEQGLGFLEEHLRQATLEPQRQILQRVLQAKADTIPLTCPQGHGPLRAPEHGLSRTLKSLVGPLSFQRSHGYCRRCQKWYFPADVALGLASHTQATPAVQELSALLVSKMPAQQAEDIAVRLTGVKLSHSLFDREGRRQGHKAQQQRAAADALFSDWEKTQRWAGTQREQPPRAPFTLIVQIDAWNIREKNPQAWGKTEELRQRQEDPEWWHWVYTGTCFGLDHRGHTASSRPIITERGYVSTRQGVDAFFHQLHAEAIRRGLAQAKDVLVIADGAIWIWKGAKDRFPNARQRLDLAHAKQHLWAVANDLHGKGTSQARAWVTPLLDQLEQDQTVPLIQTLTQLKDRVTQAQQEELRKQIQYFENNLHRLRFKEVLQARKAAKDAARANQPPVGPQVLAQADEPIGSGAIESTARQYQCRFKRPGQFWTQTGDEALLCLETFWRNGRWTDLYPHAELTDPSQS